MIVDEASSVEGAAASNQQVQVERKPAAAAKAAPAAEQPAATVNISQAALHAVASKADADGDGR